MNRSIMSAAARRGVVRYLLVLAACAALTLASCSEYKRPGPEAQNTPAASASPAATQEADSLRMQADLRRPFTLGERTFTSRQEFIESIKPRCATEEPPEPVRRSIQMKLEIFRGASPEEREAGSVEIPVYFHVITSADGADGNVSDDAIRKQIEVLNTAYAGSGPGGSGAATPFKFKLVGVDRTPNDDWFNMSYSKEPGAVEREAKAKLNKGGKSALNLYTAKLADTTLGWARWPWDFSKGVDGVVIRFSTLPGGVSAPYDQGDTATHEVGHWLGLFHTFQGGCAAPNDEVDDTPAEKSPAAGCPGAVDTCPADVGNDPVDNFMDYSDDSCMFKFTEGQSTRMGSVYSQYRK